MDWNGQERFSLSCELWVGTNDFNTKKNFLVRSNPRIIFLSGKNVFKFQNFVNVDWLVLPWYAKKLTCDELFILIREYTRKYVDL